MNSFLGVLADTHLSDGKDLVDEIKPIFKGTEGIIHAGDITEPGVLSAIESIAPVWSVYGNMDSTHLKKKLPLKRIFEWQGKRIGIFHGSKYSRGVPEEILPLFKQDPIDCLIFGHSHKPYNRMINGVLCFNPGSTYGYTSNSRSVGTITIKKNNLIGTIISL